jgi:hypothetical protein
MHGSIGLSLRSHHLGPTPAAYPTNNAVLLGFFGRARILFCTVACTWTSRHAPLRAHIIGVNRRC